MPSTRRKKAPTGCLWIEEAADHIGYEVSTLRKWRLKRYGPPSFRAGGRVVYRIDALNQWLAEQEAADPHSNPTLRESWAPVEPRLARSR
jgi:hypothetical protein